MNHKQLNRVKNLYRDGVSAQTCVSNIIGMAITDTESAIFVDKFYHNCIIDPLIKELSDLKTLMELPTEKKKDGDCKYCQNVHPGAVAKIDKEGKCVNCGKQVK